MNSFTENIIHMAVWGLTEPMKSCVSPLTVPMKADLQRGWKPTYLFQGTTGVLQRLSCHASVLVPRHCPHPPHTHKEEEILLMLDGEADLVLPDEFSPDGTKRLHLSSGQFVYYPSGFAHTLEATGIQPANYLMLNWAGHAANYSHPLGVRRFDITELKGADKVNKGLHTTRLVEGRTSTLRKLEGHLSTLHRGSGYEPHADSYDVIILMLEGEVETLGQRIGPYGAVFYRAGEPHGIHNPGEILARYLVFEFHGTEVPLTESWPFRVSTCVARKLLPSWIRRRFRGALDRLGRRFGAGQ